MVIGVNGRSRCLCDMEKGLREGVMDLRALLGPFFEISSFAGCQVILQVCEIVAPSLLPDPLL